MWTARGLPRTALASRDTEVHGAGAAWHSRLPWLDLVKSHSSGIVEVLKDLPDATLKELERVRRGLFFCPKKCTVPTKILYRTCSFDVIRENLGNDAILMDIVFCGTGRKKGHLSTMALDRRWFFQVTAELQRLPIDNSASI